MEVCGGARKALREAGHQTWRDCKSHSVAGGQRVSERGGRAPPPGSQQGSPTCVALRLVLREDDKMLGKRAGGGTREGGRDLANSLCVLDTSQGTKEGTQMRHAWLV